MAHHKSAKKRIRRNERRQVINKNRISRIRTFIRKVDEAIEAGDKKVADAAFVAAQPEIHRGVDVFIDDIFALLICHMCTCYY